MRFYTKIIDHGICHTYANTSMNIKAGFRDNISQC